MKSTSKATVGVSTIIVTGTSIEGSETAQMLCKKYSSDVGASASTADVAASLGSSSLPAASSVKLYCTFDSTTPPAFKK